jgi:hypothetical protein
MPSSMFACMQGPGMPFPMLLIAVYDRRSVAEAVRGVKGRDQRT